MPKALTNLINTLGVQNEYTATSLAEKLSIAAVGESQVMQLSITDPDPPSVLVQLLQS